MAGHWLKFERAGEHIEALEDATEAWLDTDAYTIVRDVDPQSGRTVRRAKITEAPPYSLSLIAGDAIHNLRAALDHVIYAISESHFGAAFTPKIAAGLAFPIVGNVNRHGAPVKGAETFKVAQAETLCGVPNAARDFIEQVQPYYRDPTGMDFRWDELWWLHDLDRIDKHRRLSVTTACLGMPSASVSGPKDQIAFHHAGGPVQDGDKLVSYPRGEEGIHAFLPREVALDEGPECQTLEIGSLVDAIARRVRYVLTVLDGVA